jgi:hypothetical protein
MHDLTSFPIELIQSSTGSDNPEWFIRVVFAAVNGGNVTVIETVRIPGIMLVNCKEVQPVGIIIPQAC